MKFNNFIDVELLFKCCCIWIFLYCTIIAVIEISFYYVLVPLAIYLAIFFLTLNPPNLEEVNNIFGENPRSQFRNLNFEYPFDTSHLPIAYKAAGFDFKANTMEAVKKCIERGCKFIHVDINVTADNVVVMGSKYSYPNDDHHQISKSVEECSHAELSFDHTNETKETEISTLQDLLSFIEGQNVKIIFNVIHSLYYRSSESVVKVILQAFQKNPELYKISTVCSTNVFFLYSLRKRDPSIVITSQWIGFSEEPISTISWLQNLRCHNGVYSLIVDVADSFSWWLFNNFISRVLGVSAVILPKHIITPSVVENWERKNVRCIAAVVNLSTEKAYYTDALGIAYLTDSLSNNKIQAECVH